MPRKMNAHHDAHIEAFHDHLASTQADTRPRVRARDYTTGIRETKFAKDHPHEWIIRSIDAALNEYQDLCSARELHTESETAERERAKSLIKKLQSTFDEIARNRFASAALIKAFCRTDDPAQLDRMILNLSSSIESIEEPRAARGRPETPGLDWLISRIADLVVRAREQTIRDEEEEKPDVRAKELAIMRRAKKIKRNDKIGRAYTEELLAVGNVIKAGSTLDNKLANLTHHQKIAAEQRVELNHLPASIIAPDS